MQRWMHMTTYSSHIIGLKQQPVRPRMKYNIVKIFLSNIFTVFLESRFCCFPRTQKYILIQNDAILFKIPTLIKLLNSSEFSSSPLNTLSTPMLQMTKALESMMNMHVNCMTIFYDCIRSYKFFYGFLSMPCHYSTKSYFSWQIIGKLRP